MALQVQRRLPECGRIRIGRKGKTAQGKEVPQKLDTFRLTSKDKTALDAAAKLYGGRVTPWLGHDGEFELITTVNELPIFIHPDPPPSTWYELWSAGGCLRRCDGNECSIPADNGLKQVECMCDPENRACGLKTRVTFLLPDIPALGTWRLETGSIYAAMEMPGLIEMMLAGRNSRAFPEAVLALTTRRVIRQKNGKPETRVFPVVTIRIRGTLRQIMGEDAIQREIEAPSAARMIAAPSEPSDSEALHETFSVDVLRARSLAELDTIQGMMKDAKEKLTEEHQADLRSKLKIRREELRAAGIVTDIANYSGDEDRNPPDVGEFARHDPPGDLGLDVSATSDKELEAIAR